MEMSISECKRHVHELEQWNLRHKLRVVVPNTIQYTRNPENTITELITVRLGLVDFKEDSIRSCHILPTRQDMCTSVIQAEFLDSTLKTKIYHLRRKLRKEIVKIFINEDLPLKTARLFKSAREMANNMKCARVWTINGKILFKMTHNTPPREISSESDLWSVTNL